MQIAAITSLPVPSGWLSDSVFCSKWLATSCLQHVQISDMLLLNYRYPEIKNKYFALITILSAFTFCVFLIAPGLYSDRHQVCWYFLLTLLICWSKFPSSRKNIHWYSFLEISKKDPRSPQCNFVKCNCWSFWSGMFILVSSSGTLYGVIAKAVQLTITPPHRYEKDKQLFF